MTDEKIFDTIVRVFEWNILPLDQRSAKPPKPSDYSLTKEFRKNPNLFNSEELGKLANLAVRLLIEWNSGNGYEIFNLCHIMSMGGAIGYHTPLVTGLQVDPYCPTPVNAHAHSIMVEMLAQAGVFRAGEKPLYHDRGELFIEKTNVSRSGMLLLTDQRLFIVGPENYGWQTGYRLTYGERWKTDRWLKSLDYLELNLLGEGIVKNNGVRFIYNDGCIKTSKHEFYGPLWIRFPLDDTFSYKKGPVNVYIKTLELDRMMKGVPKDDARRRIALITKKIREIQSS